MAELDLTHGVKLVKEDYCDCVELEYVNRQEDRWYGDSTETVEINYSKAQEIISFLRDSFS